MRDFTVIEGKQPHQFYSDDDPVWKVIPTIDQCIDLWRAVVEQALGDASGWQLANHNVSLGKKPVNDPHYKRHISPARLYLDSKAFEEHCEFAGYNYRALRKGMKRYMNG